VPVLRVLRGGGELGGEPRPDAAQGHPLVHQADPLLAIVAHTHRWLNGLRSYVTVAGVLLSSSSMFGERGDQLWAYVVFVSMSS
jgi:hypothetical protein